MNNNNKRFSVCGTLRKQDCIELLKNNLTADELKAIIQPNSNQIIRFLKALTKKENQYLLYNTTKIGMDKINHMIRKNAVMEGGESEDEDNIKKGTNLIDIEEEEQEINTNADLLLTSIMEVKKETETQTDDTNTINQLQLAYIENNKPNKPKNLKKTAHFNTEPQQNEKLVFLEDCDEEIEFIEPPKNEPPKYTADTFMKTDKFIELKKIIDLKKIIKSLKEEIINGEEIKKILKALTEYQKNRLLKIFKNDKKQYEMVKDINDTQTIYELIVICNLS